MDHQRPVRIRSGRRPMLPAVALLAFASLAACRERPAEKEAPEAAAIPPPPTVPPAERAKQREKAIAGALQQAPQLNRAAAQMLLADAERRGVPYGDVRDWSLLIANRGFSRLPSERLKELGDLFTKIYASMPEADRTLVMAYVERLRRGALGTADTDERARALMSGGIGALPEAARGRLQALFEASIAAVLEDERQTASLAAESSGTPTPRPRREEWGNPVETTMETDDGGAEDARRRAREDNERAQQEDQKGSQAAQYKQELAYLEQSVRSAEDGVRAAQEELR